MNAQPSFRYAGSAVRIIAGGDTLAHLGAEVGRTGAKRALIVCGHSVAQRTNLLDRARASLGGLYAGVFDGVQSESPLPSVGAGVAAARSLEADCIVAIGGGSAVVTARAITILLAESGAIHDLSTQYPPGRPPVSPRLLQPKLPQVVVLTTPTTAANRPGAAVLDPERHHRIELFDPKARPVTIILDTDALLTAPTDLYVSTSATTLSGTISSLQSPTLNLFSEADLNQALKLLQRSLPRALDNPEAGEARLELAVAAMLSNRAADASGGGAGGITTALAHSLQARYAWVHQGAAMSVLLAPGMRFNRPVLLPHQARLAAALGVRTAGMSDEEAATAAIAGVQDLLRRVRMPQRLRDLNVPEADLDLLAADALTDFFLTTNPRPVQGKDELLGVLREAW